VRIVSKLLAATAAAAITALMAGPALADPIPVGTIPKATDVVGVGSDTTESVFDQLSVDYNATHTTGKLYSWDATPQGGTITPKAGCSSTTPRPTGSTAGIGALENTAMTGTHPCIDFARSSRDRGQGPTPDPNTISFIDVAGDAVTYATQPGSHAPNNLTTAQLTAIYSCSVSNWSQVGGTAGKIIPMLPQSGSGTRGFFLTAIGLTAPGSCVSTSATVQGAAGNGANTLEENEGVDPSLNKNKTLVIFPFSVGKWIAEKFHSASCGTTTQCFANETKCTPTGSQNMFGCNLHGSMVLNHINGTSPTVGTGQSTVINKRFTGGFTRVLFEVTNNPGGGTTPVVPPNLAKYFGPTGFTCTNATAKAHLKSYGFLVLTAGTAPGDCGSVH
jgi:ABC-type phosphate transport system substrate-binding protein